MKNIVENYEGDKEILVYGLKTLEILIKKTLLFALITIIFNIFTEFIIFIFFFSIIRLTAFGIHLNSSLKCTIISFILFFTSILFSTLNIQLYLKMIIFLSSIISIIINAPAENKRGVEKRKYKIISITIALIYGTIIFSNTRISNLVLFALLLESILITKTIRRFKWVD